MKYKLYANGDITGSNGKGSLPDRMQELALKERSFSITTKNYREILCSAIKLTEINRYRLEFLTLTFPFSGIDEKDGNLILTHFLGKLKRAYNVKNYIWTKERQSNDDQRLHYHILIDLPFIPVKTLQTDYNQSIVAITGFSGTLLNNSLRFPPRSHRISKMGAISVAKYIAKYIAKERKIIYKMPCFCISRGLRNPPKDITNEEMSILIKKRGIKHSFGNQNFAVIMLKNSV